MDKPKFDDLMTLSELGTYERICASCGNVVENVALDFEKDVATILPCGHQEGSFLRKPGMSYDRLDRVRKQRAEQEERLKLVRLQVEEGRKKQATGEIGHSDTLDNYDYLSRRVYELQDQVDRLIGNPPYRRTPEQKKDARLSRSNWLAGIIGFGLVLMISAVIIYTPGSFLMRTFAIAALTICAIIIVWGIGFIWEMYREILTDRKGY